MSVGIAACVSAIMVNAAATAVFCTSAAFIVGAAGSPPQALTIRVATTITVRMERRFMLCEYLLMKLAVGETSGPGLDAVIFHNNRPVAFCDAETTECLEILLARDKCTGSILSNGSREAVSGDDEIPALTQFCHHIHRQDDRPLRVALVGNAEICRGSLPGCEGLVAVILTASAARAGCGLRLRHLLRKGRRACGVCGDRSWRSGGG